jgi:hypothetical protein
MDMRVNRLRRTFLPSIGVVGLRLLAFPLDHGVPPYRVYYTTRFQEWHLN